MAVTRVHLTVSLPAETWQACRDRWPNRKASHVVAAALNAWLVAHQVPVNRVTDGHKRAS